MTIEGRIAIDASFSDSTSSSGVQSLKRISLTSTDSYSTGKVALLTGTVGTAAVALTLSPTTYRDASGSLVSFVTVQRAVVRANVGSLVFHRYEEHSVGETAAVKGTLIGSGHVAVVSLDNTDLDPLAAGSPAVQSYSGTSSYTIVIYGT